MSQKRISIQLVVKELLKKDVSLLLQGNFAFELMALKQLVFVTLCPVLSPKSSLTWTRHTGGEVQVEMKQNKHSRHYFLCFLCKPAQQQQSVRDQLVILWWICSHNTHHQYIQRYLCQRSPTYSIWLGRLFSWAGGVLHKPPSVVGW